MAGTANDFAWRPIGDGFHGGAGMAAVIGKARTNAVRACGKRGNEMLGRFKQRQLPRDVCKPSSVVNAAVTFIAKRDDVFCIEREFGIREQLFDVMDVQLRAFAGRVSAVLASVLIALKDLMSKEDPFGRVQDLAWKQSAIARERARDVRTGWAGGHQTILVLFGPSELITTILTDASKRGAGSNPGLATNCSGVRGASTEECGRTM
jgi:hypothetical protein